MAKTTRELGLFVPPEKERQLHELEEVQVEQDTRVRRRMMFRWMGWGAVLVLLGQWSIGFISFFAPKRLGAFGGAVAAGLVTDFKVGDVKQVREGKFYITRVPEGFFALYWKCPHLGCTVPWAPQDPAMPGRRTAGTRPLPTRAASSAPATARSTTATGRLFRAPPRARWTAFHSTSTRLARSSSRLARPSPFRGRSPTRQMPFPHPLSQVRQAS